MERTCEPELMDDEAQARAYSEADFEAPHNHFVTLMQEALGDELKGRALDLGCGPADVTARVARAFPDLVIEGVDGAEAMLALGRERLAALGLDGRVRLHRCFLPDALPGSDYDVVFSNSLLHHLHEPAVMWQSVRAAARDAAPGATSLFVMDLMRPASEEDASRLVELYAEGEPEVLRRDFYCSLLAAFRVDEVRAQLDVAGLSSLTVEAVSDRHLVVRGRF